MIIKTKKSKIPKDCGTTTKVIKNVYWDTRRRRKRGEIKEKLFGNTT